MPPDTITIRAVAEEVLDADSADLYVTIEGTALFSGNEAFKKAKELQELVTALGEFGIDLARIRLRNVRSTSQTFAVFKSSSARYSITVASVSLELLSSVLGAIAARKNSDLKAIAWNYSQILATRLKLREQALLDAKAQAVSAAKLLGVALLGIHSLSESNEKSDRKRDLDYDDDDVAYAQAAFGGRHKRATTELEFTLGNSKKVIVDIQAQFSVGPFSSPS